MNCTSIKINSLLNYEEKCQFINQNCPYNYINFYYLYYCLLKSSLLPSIIIFLIILILLFFILSSTSDLFLSTAMVKLIETYKINQNVAAVTLIAFGNCAPDIISSLVASENDNISFSIGSIIGSGMFITSFVFGLVVFKGKEILVNSLMFNRDLILYLISLSVIIFIGIKKNITLFDSLGLIAIYIVNVFLAFFQGKKINKDIKDNKANDNKDSIDDDEDKEKIIKRDNDVKDINEINDNVINSKYKPIELEQKNSNIDYFYKVYLTSNFNQDIINKQIFGEIKEDIDKEQEAIIEIKKAYSQLINENLILAKIFFKKKFLFDKEKKWNEIPNYLKLFYIVFEFPLIIIREITIPICENKKWNKIKFCLLPLSDFLFISYIFNCKLDIFLIFNFFLYFFSIFHLFK